MGALAIMGDQPVLTLRPASKLAAKPVTWAVDQIIPSGMLTVFSGKDKLGKTLLAWEMARSVLNGEPFLGQFSVSQGPVIFLALDDPTVVTIDRLERLEIKDTADLHVATPLDCQHKHHGFWKEVAIQTRLLKPKMIVVDALYLFLDGGSESMNQASAMARVMQPLNELAEETGAAVLLITHDTKSGGDVAGSFVIRAAAKQILRLEGSKDQHTVRTLYVEGKLAEQTTWTLKFEGPRKWGLSDEESLSLTQTRAAVEEWLKQGNRGTAEAIAETLKKRQATVRMILKQLIAEGLATSNKKRGPGRGRSCVEYSWNSRPIPIEPEAGREIPAESKEVLLAS